MSYLPFVLEFLIRTSYHLIIVILTCFGWWGFMNLLLKIPRIENFLHKWWFIIEKSEFPTLGKNEARAILEFFQSIANNKIKLIAGSIILTSFSMSFGIILFLISNYEKWRNVLSIPELVNEVGHLACYILILTNIFKGVLSKVDLKEALFNSFLRFILYLFFFNEIITPFLKSILIEDSLRLSSISIAGSFFLTVAVIYENILQKNKLYSFSRFCLLYFLLLFWLILLVFITRQNPALFFAEIYFSLDKWLLNLVFDLTTFFITLKLLRKIKNSNSFQNFGFISLDVLFAMILALSLFWGYYILDNFFTALFYKGKILSLEQIWDAVRLQREKAINNIKLPHFFYSFTTFLPTIVYFLLIFTSYLIKSLGKNVYVLLDFIGVDRTNYNGAATKFWVLIGWIIIVSGYWLENKYSLKELFYYF